MLHIKNAQIRTGTGAVINGDLLIEDGKFKEIGSISSSLENVKTIDAEGKIITPGLIDVHTHLGVHAEGVGKAGHDFNEISSESTPEVSSLDGIQPQDIGFDDARRAGVTTVQIMPGSANVIGGEMVIVKTAAKSVVDEMIVKNPSGLKAATGENPKNTHGGKGKMPTTRMGVAGRLREMLIAGQNYLEQRESGTCNRNLGLENIGKVLKREIPLRIHAHRADDIATALRIKREFNIDMTIEHCTEGHLMADFIAQHDIRVSVGPTMSARSKNENSQKGWHTLIALREAGVPFSITTDHPVVGITHLLTSAILAIKHGLTEEEALAAITLNAAKHLGVESQVGSIEIGKDADFVIWNGDPFDLRTTIQQTYINGSCVYNAAQ
ncbi:amidohydrolase [Metasolibacillus sp. FSL H7-0170]|uniref:amidohydrolase n=1 Tax=Metasolibacillus TaxID=2703677 RepID=UPI001F3C5EDC|nr:amidohydrolase [Metasolibacillus fluoroglycofenilyticus]